MTVSEIQPLVTRNMKRGGSLYEKKNDCKSIPTVDPFDLAAQDMEDALKKYIAMDKPEIFLDKLTRLTKKFGIGMFFYERETWEETDFDCVLGFTDPIHRNRCILADQDMAVADFWRKRTKKQMKQNKDVKRPFNSIEQKCDIHNRTADDTHVPLINKSEQPNSVNIFKSQRIIFDEDEKENNEQSTVNEYVDTVTATATTTNKTTTTTTEASLSATDITLGNKQKTHAQAIIALGALDTAKKLMKSEGKNIEKLPEYFKDVDAVINWAHNMWQHDRRACQASAQMRFERNMHAIYLFRLKYITQLLFQPGGFEYRIGGDDYERVHRYIRGGGRLMRLAVEYGLPILLLADHIHAYALGKDTDNGDEWRKEIDHSIVEGAIADAFNLVNVEFFKSEYSWSAVPALEQVACWFFQAEFLKYTPYP
ncbi:hypothetical protein BDC45DRAFT_521852 [Circinella umbellata]|nr:hypothetical protein BDC45DRAFT_521852 [Circinella umbellata]